MKNHFLIILQIHKNNKILFKNKIKKFNNLLGNGSYLSVIIKPLLGNEIKKSDLKFNQQVKLIINKF
jgi:hypothetical protein